nr:uncharacterized protein LOC124491165 isoform X2 [Dermatophagoides farinae]
MMTMVVVKKPSIFVLFVATLAIFFIPNGQCQYGSAKNKGVVVETSYQKPVIETSNYEEEPIWKEEPEYQPEIIKEEKPSYTPKEVIVSKGSGSGYGSGGGGGGSSKSAAIREEPIWQEEQPSYSPKEVVVSRGSSSGYGASGKSAAIWNEQPKQEVWKEDYHQQPKVITKIVKEPVVITKVVKEPVVVTKVVKQPIVKVIRVVEKVPVYKQPVYHKVWVKKTYGGGGGYNHGGGYSHGGGYNHGGGGYNRQWRRRRSISRNVDNHPIQKRKSKWREYKKQIKQAKYGAKQEKREKWRQFKKGDFGGGYEQPKHHGYEQPKHHGYEQPKHHGYEQPEHHHQSYGYGHRARRSYNDVNYYDDDDQYINDQYQSSWTKEQKYYDEEPKIIQKEEKIVQKEPEITKIYDNDEEISKLPIGQPELTPEIKDYNANQQVSIIKDENVYQSPVDEHKNGYNEPQSQQEEKIIEQTVKQEEKYVPEEEYTSKVIESKPEIIKQPDQESYQEEEKKIIEYEPKEESIKPVIVTEKKIIQTKKTTKIITTPVCNSIMDNILEHLQPEFMQHMSSYVINNVEPIRLGRWGRVQLHDGHFNHMGPICRGNDFRSTTLGNDKYMIEGTIQVPEPKCEFEADAGMYNRLRFRNQCIRLAAKDATFHVAMFLDKKRNTVHVAELEPLELNDFHMEDERGRTAKNGGMRWPFKRISQWQLEPHRQQFMQMLTHELCDKFREMIHRPEVAKEIIEYV